MKINITTININNRIRKDFGDIEGLSNSLTRYGQLQPIIIDEAFNLIAGERRLRAATELGWTEIDATSLADLDPVTKHEIELEENIRRKEFTWPEEVVGLSELYKMRLDRQGKRVQGSRDGTGYGLKDAATELERSIGSISMDLQLAEALAAYPQLAEEKSKVAAFKRFRLLKENLVRREIAARTRPPTEVQMDGPAGDSSSPSPASVRKVGFKGHGIIYLGDSRNILRHMDDASVDCIVTDPPFGIALHSEGAATTNSRLAANIGHNYDDDPYKIKDMLDMVFKECARILKPDGHAYFFFHHNRYQEILTILERHFQGAVEPTPVIWIKNTAGIGDPNRSWVYAYEPMFFVNRGRMLAKPRAFNYIQVDTVPGKSKIHPTEKPTALLRHIIEASAVEGEVVLDPFAGSGSTLVAAFEQSCKFIGIELEEAFYNRIVDRLSISIGEREQA